MAGYGHNSGDRLDIGVIRLDWMWIPGTIAAIALVVAATGYEVIGHNLDSGNPNPLNKVPNTGGEGSDGTIVAVRPSR